MRVSRLTSMYCRPPAPTRTACRVLQLKRPLREPRASKAAAVAHLIDTLGLVPCKDVACGDAMTKGISGGQAKVCRWMFNLHGCSTCIEACLHAAYHTSLM